MPARYPHEAALILRRSERVRAEGELAGAQRALEQARAALQAAKDALALHVADERGAVSGQAGPRLAAIELQRAAAFAQQQALAARSLRAAVDRADAELQQVQAGFERAQQTLAAAHGRERAVEQDREQFERDERRSAEQAEEDEDLEQRAARKKS